MSEHLKMQITMVIDNAITIICFTVLSIALNKWWIILISAFFLSYVKKS